MDPVGILLLFFVGLVWFSWLGFVLFRVRDRVGDGGRVVTCVSSLVHPTSLPETFLFVSTFVVVVFLYLASFIEFSLLRLVMCCSECRVVWKGFFVLC